MRFTDEEIVKYAIAQATRMVRDKDELTYTFKFGSTDEKEYWMLCHQYKWRTPANPEYNRGCLYKDRLGRFTRQNYFRSRLHKGKTLESVFSGPRYAKATWPLVEMQFELNKDRAEILAKQILDGFILDLNYIKEPYLEIDPRGAERVSEFYNNEQYKTPYPESHAEKKVLPFPS